MVIYAFPMAPTLQYLAYILTKMVFSCNEQERRAKKAKKQQQQLQQQQTSQAAASAAAGKSPRQPSSSSSQPLQNQVIGQYDKSVSTNYNQVITGSKSKINRRSPEKEAVRKNILIGNITSSKVKCYSLHLKI